MTAHRAIRELVDCGVIVAVGREGSAKRRVTVYLPGGSALTGAWIEELEAPPSRPDCRRRENARKERRLAEREEAKGPPQTGAREESRP